MKKKLASSVAIIMAVSMSLPLSALSDCTIKSAASVKKAVTLTYLLDASEPSDYSTYKNSDVVKYMLKQTGVSLKLEYVNDDKYNVLLAGGDLPDIIRAKSSQFKQLINAEMSFHLIP